MKNISSVPQGKNRVTRLVPLLAICGAFGLMGGCASEPESHLVSAPPPAQAVVSPGVAVVPMAGTVMTTTQTTQTTPNGTYVTNQTQPMNTIIVTQAPPAPQAEAVLAQPSSAHAWVAGYWTWRNNQYQWMAGHWEVPPYANSKWMAPRWQTENGSYRFYEGFWN